MAVGRVWEIIMKNLIAFLFSAVAMVASALANAPIAKVPYTANENGWLTVSASVNGQGPFPFIIDTGASQTLAFQPLADAVGFSPTGGELQTVLGLADQGQFAPYYLGDINVGAAKLENLVSVVLPEWGVEGRPFGILGLDFLRKYILIFDAENQILNIYDRAAPPAEEATRRWKSATLIPESFGIEGVELYVIEARVNGRRVDFLVDLGASGTIINRQGVAKIMRSGYSISVRPTGADTAARITDALRREENARYVRTRRIQFGRNNWYNRIIAIHNAQILTELGVNSKAFGILGVDMVAGRSFMLDLENGRMEFGPKTK